MLLRSGLLSSCVVGLSVLFFSVSFAVLLFSSLFPLAKFPSSSSSEEIPSIAESAYRLAYVIALPAPCAVAFSALSVSGSLSIHSPDSCVISVVTVTFCPSPEGLCKMLRPCLDNKGLTRFKMLFKGAYLLLKYGLVSVLAGFFTSA